MNKKYIYIGLFIVTIIGLSIVQYQYFRIGLNLAGVQFNEKMGAVLEDVKKDFVNKNELTFLIGSALKDEEADFNLSKDSVQEASVYFLDSYLKEKMLQNGIKTDYGFHLYSTDSINYLTSNTYHDDIDDIVKFPIQLEGYLPTLLEKQLILELQFKNVNKYFLSQLNGLTIPSIIFLIILIAVITWVFRAFYLQKNLITTTNEFINNLTHELKTPVFSIGVASKILEEKVNDDQKELVGMIRTQVDRLNGQIEKVLELEIIEGKKNFMDLKEIDLKPVIDSIVNNYKELSTIENFSFTGKISGNSFDVLGDVYHLENSIISLLENAKKYSEQDVWIQLEAFIENKFLVITVTDRGIGIGEEEKKKIFDKYYRVSQGDIHTVKGYGLGLHYVKRVVHLHRGSIKVTSNLGKGSIFRIKIPLLRND